jgi:hypothetical protein
LMKITYVMKLTAISTRIAPKSRLTRNASISARPSPWRAGRARHEGRRRRCSATAPSG